MNSFPDGMTPLYDTIIRTAITDTDNLVFRVDLIDRYNDGPDVPGRIGSSPIFTTLDEAVAWARNAIEKFKGIFEGR